MASTLVGKVEIAYEEFGLPGDPALILVAGLGTQMYFFEDEFVHGLVDRAFRVIRFDNRDAGLSSKFDNSPVELQEVLTAVETGKAIKLPYSIREMAADIVALLDHLDIKYAHLLGNSLGGMICQDFAVYFAERVCSLTLLSTTSGNPEVGQPSPDALAALLAPYDEHDRESAVARDVASRRIWATPDHFDEQWTRAYFERAYDRSYHPGGSTRQLAAAITAPDREPALRLLDVPTLVIHGSKDQLIAPDGGAHLARLIPGAEYLELEGMGHDLPKHYWGPIIEAVTSLAIRSSG